MTSKSLFQSGGESVVPAGYVGQVLTGNYSRTFGAAPTGWYNITATNLLTLPAGGTWIVTTIYAFPQTGFVSNYLTLIASASGDVTSPTVFGQQGTPVLGSVTGGGAFHERTDIASGLAATALYPKIYVSNTPSGTIDVTINAIRIA